MNADHHRFDELAVGHVLGGLSQEDASDFRSHLLECRHCRRRVAELRDLASNLQAVEREERAALRVRTETAEQAEIDAPPRSRAGAGAGSRLGTPALVVVLVLLAVGLAFWNYHLRSQTGELLRVTAEREQILEVIATGTPGTVTLSSGVTGVVVRDGSRVAWVFDGIPDLGAGERLVVWLGTGDAMRPKLILPSGGVADGRVADVTDDETATRLLLTVEPITVPTSPSSAVMAEAALAKP
jgi:hypothetical protein